MRSHVLSEEAKLSLVLSFSFFVAYAIVFSIDQRFHLRRKSLAEILNILCKMLESVVGILDL